MEIFQPGKSGRLAILPSLSVGVFAWHKSPRSNLCHTLRNKQSIFYKKNLNYYYYHYIGYPIECNRHLTILLDEEGICTCHVSLLFHCHLVCRSSLTAHSMTRLEENCLYVPYIYKKLNERNRARGLRIPSSVFYFDNGTKNGVLHALL